jgi:hypothetical protein
MRNGNSIATVKLAADSVVAKTRPYE